MASTMLYISSLVMKPSLSTSYNRNAPTCVEKRGREREAKYQEIRTVNKAYGVQANEDSATQIMSSCLMGSHRLKDQSGLIYHLEVALRLLRSTLNGRRVDSWSVCHVSSSMLWEFYQSFCSRCYFGKWVWNLAYKLCILLGFFASMLIKLHRLRCQYATLNWDWFWLRLCAKPCEVMC